MTGDQMPQSVTDTASVEVRVSADLGQLAILRALAETVALVADLTLDEASDVRLAVDEVASILIVAAVRESELHCQFVIGKTGVVVRVSTVSLEQVLPDQNNFGWHVLRTLTDTIAATQHAFDPTTSGFPTTVEFSRMRGAADG